MENTGGGHDSGGKGVGEGRVVVSAWGAEGVFEV